MILVLNKKGAAGVSTKEDVIKILDGLKLFKEEELKR